MSPTLTITIRSGAQGAYPVTADLRLGASLRAQRHLGTLRLDLEQLRAAEHSAYGQMLGAALFTGQGSSEAQGCAQIGLALNALRAAGDPRPRLLLTVEDPDLQGLAWGRLHIPITESDDLAPLAGSRQLIYAGYVPTATTDSFPPLPPAVLRALVLAASPPDQSRYGIAPFDAGAAVAAARSGLGDLPTTLLASLPGSDGPPTLDALVSALSRQRHHLLHIICHGRQTSHGPTIYLEDAASQEPIKPISAEELIGRLRGLGPERLPYLIFLSTCESAAASAEFAGLAQLLVRQLGIPAVVAMSDKISIASANALSAAFYRELREHGEADRALSAALVEIQSRHDVSMPLCITSLPERPIITYDLAAPLQPAEVERGLALLADLCAERAPVMCAELEQHARELRGRDPHALGDAPRAAYQRHLKAVESLCITLAELTFAALARGQSPAPYINICPFPGLAAFQPTQQPHFFGRDLQIAALRAALQPRIAAGSWSMLTITGSSGVGKSSLVLAGLIPRLRQERPDLRVDVIVPGEAPLAALESLPAAAGPRLLVVDQAEELLTLSRDPRVRRAFVDALVARGLPTLLIVRGDYLISLGDDPQLRAQISAPSTYTLYPLSPDELRSVAERQAASVGLQLEDGLGATILHDVDAESTPLPLLQHALRALWERRRGRWLLRKDYDDLGRLQGVLARTADEAYQTAPPDQQAQIRRVLQRLCSFSLDAEASEDLPLARRRISRAQLLEWAPGAEAAIHLLDRQGLIVERDGRYELAHDALLNAWQQLRAWVSADREQHRRHDRLRQRAAEWHAAGRPGDSLLRGMGLLDARALAEQTHIGPLERAFLSASEASADAERRRLLRQRATLAALLLASLIAATAAAIYARESQRQAARSRTLALVSGARAALAEDNSAQALALALAAFDTGATTPELEATLAEAAYRPGAIWRRQIPGVQINQLALSPDGLTALAAGGDGSVYLLDPADGAVLSQLAGHAGPVLAVAFIDGQTACSGGADGTIRRWDLRTGVETARWVGHRAAVTSLAPLPDGAALLSGSDDNTLRLWQLSDGRELASLGPQRDALGALALSPDGRYALSASASGREISLWDLAARRTLHLADLPTQADAIGLLSRNGGYTWLVGSGRAVELRDPGTGALRASLPPATDRLTRLTATSDGSLIIGGDLTGRIYVWSVADQRLLATIAGDGEPVVDLRPMPDGESVLTVSRSGGLRRLAIVSGAALGETALGPGARPIWAAAEPSGHTFLLGAHDGALVRYDPASQASRPLLPPEPADGAALLTYHFTSSPTQIARSVERASPDGEQRSAELQLYDLATDRILWRLSLPEPGVAALSPDGRTLALGDQRGVRLLDSATGAPRAQIDVGHVASLAFSPSGAALAVGTYAGAALLVTPTDTPAIRWRSPPGAGGYLALAYSPDGTIIAAGGADGQIQLLAADTGATLRGLPGYSRSITQVAFSPDGALLIGGSADPSVRTWDVQRGIELRRFIGHSAPISAVAISADRRFSLSGDESGSLRLWRLDSLPDLAAWARARRHIPDLSCAERATYALPPCPGV